MRTDSNGQRVRDFVVRDFAQYRPLLQEMVDLALGYSSKGREPLQVIRAAFALLRWHISWMENEAAIATITSRAMEGEI